MAPSPTLLPLATAAALCAFAANSILCRLALRTEEIDPASFTTIRLVSGALTLWLVMAVAARRGGKSNEPSGGTWISASLLFLYAIAVSFAYVTLNAGVGALILFGAVQLTMILRGQMLGERLPLLAWLGLSAAIGGLVVLVAPGIAMPDPLGAVLMAVAGISWGFYSLRGRGSKRPMAATAGNFLRAAPLAIAASGIALGWLAPHSSPFGVLLAITSGAVTSGLGYVIWYAALPGLTASRAAAVQLTVPVIAAAVGVVLLGEDLTLRLLVSVVLTLGGVGLVVGIRGRAGKAKAESGTRKAAREG